MASKRQKTEYKGIYYRTVDRVGRKGQEKVYYAVFKRDGVMIEAKCGKQYVDNMTAAKAAFLRGEMIEGRRLTRQEKRAEEAARTTLTKLWTAYSDTLKNKASKASDTTNFGHLAPLHSKYPESIVTADLDAIRLKLEKGGKKPQTVKHVITLVRRIINYGVKRGLCQPINPARLSFTLPTFDNRVTESLSPDQLQHLFEVLAEYHDQDVTQLIRWALCSGMRKKAILNLRWADVRNRIKMIAQSHFC